jgi:hypothetical protein
MSLAQFRVGQSGGIFIDMQKKGNEGHIAGLLLTENLKSDKSLAVFK